MNIALPLKALSLNEPENCYKDLLREDQEYKGDEEEYWCAERDQEPEALPKSTTSSSVDPLESHPGEDTPVHDKLAKQ
jgi:hypothetical protein